MADRDHDHPYLPVGRPTYASRTFLGGSKLSTRTGLFVAIGMAAIIAFTGLIVHVNNRLSSSLLGLERAQSLDALVTSVGRGNADLVSHEKTFLLTRDPRSARQIRDLLDAFSRGLDRLGAHPDAGELERPIATLKDGVVQIDQHLSSLVKARPDSPAVAGQALRDADAALAPRLATSGRRAAPGLLARIDQLGSEMTLTGDPANLEALQEAYGALQKDVSASSLPRGEKRVIDDLIAKHQAAMMSLITARVTVNEDSQRFDDIQAYMAPSLGDLNQVAGELLGERMAKVADARKAAAAGLVGGGAAIILWLVALGLTVMRSLTRPVQALAEAAHRLALGDRVVTIPGRGNRDAIGLLARAFDNWIGAMTDAEHLRQDLDHAQAKTVQAVEARNAALARAEAATEEVDSLRHTLADYRREMDEMEALLAEMADEQSTDEPEDQLPEPTTALARAQAKAMKESRKADPRAVDPTLADVTDHLAQVSGHASTAIIDVELADTLMRNLGAARGQLDDLEGAIGTVRDRFNQFLFAKPAPGQPMATGQDGKAVALGGGALRQASLNDPEARQRLVDIRDAVDRAERTLAGCTREVDRVTDAAQRLAAQAAAEARMATEQLSAQSDYLKNLVDTLGRPAAKSRAVIPGPSNRIKKPSGTQGRDAG